MINVIVDGVLLILTIIILWFLLVISCNIIEIIWLCIFRCSSPFLCPIRQREHWIVEICNCIIKITGRCSICCVNIKQRLKKYREKINKNKVNPIVYDDVHVIVINPYDKYQIATISSVKL